MGNVLFNTHDSDLINIWPVMGDQHEVVTGSAGLKYLNKIIAFERPNISHFGVVSCDLL